MSSLQVVVLALRPGLPARILGEPSTPGRGEPEVLGGVEMSVLGQQALPASGALGTAHISLLRATATLSTQWRVLVGTGPDPAFFVLFCLETGLTVLPRLV